MKVINETTYAKRPDIVGAPVSKEESARREMTEAGMSVEQLLAAASLDLRKIYPFLFAALYAVPRIESNEVGGISVSPTKIYYNSSFIKLCSRPAVLYFLIHGLYHILMRHHARGFAKDPSLWNDACDLYINKCLAEAYGAEPGEGPVEVTNDEGETVLFEIPAGEKYEDWVNVKKDTPESIYRDMATQNDEDDQDDPDQSDEEGVGENSGDDSQEGEKGKDAEEGEGDEGQKQSDEEGGDEGDEDDRPTEETTPEEDAESDQESDEPSDTSDQGENGSQGKSDETDSSQGEDEQDSGKDSDVSEPSDEKEETDEHGEGGSEEGAPKNPDIQDMIDDAQSRSESPTNMAQDSERLLTKVETIYRQLSEATYGRGTRYDPVAQAEIDAQKIRRLNWRTLLRNKLISITTDEKSLSHPDRRFVHTGLYLEGTVIEEIQLRDVKVCVDTSASISDVDVQIALLQIRDLLRAYHIDADLVFWDEEVEAVLPFSDVREFNLARDKAIGRGGTNPTCLFEAFAQSNRRGHTEPTPSLVIIFTDGYFETPDPKYRRAFSDKTMWVLSSENSKPLSEFNPGFGSIVTL